MEVGMPRNDLLVKHTQEAAEFYRTKIQEEYNIPQNSLIVLYAPTWRDGVLNIKQLDLSELEKVLEEKYNKNISILIRAHRKLAGVWGDGGINATDYPDMQELLMASDILISDYSSCIWDYSFLGRPCFLYVPDLIQYTQDVGFDEKIDNWGFPVCSSNKELQRAIADFNIEVFNEAMEKHHLFCGSFESGNAARYICERIVHTTQNC